MGYWKKIRKIETDQGVDVRAIRAVSNSLGEFKSTVLISVSSELVDDVMDYTQEQLQTFVEQNCDIDAIEDGLAQSAYPEEPEDNLVYPPDFSEDEN